MNPRRAVATVALAIAIGATAGCGDGAPTTQTAAVVSIGTAGATLSGAPAVTIQTTGGNTFDPSTTTVKVGQVVEWKNPTGTGHTISFDDASVSQPSFGGGATWEIKFTTAGTFNYSCTIHPGMTGTVTVG